MSKKLLLAALLAAGVVMPEAAVQASGPATCESFARYAVHWNRFYRARGCSEAYTRPMSVDYYYRSCRSDAYNDRHPRAMGYRAELARRCGM